MSQGKILVIRGGAIGDFILTLPVFAALRQQFPRTRLEVLGYPHIAQLALAGGLVDAVQSIEARALAGFFARRGRLDPGLVAYFADFAIVISYLYDPDGIFQENVARCSSAQFICGPHRPDEKLPLHATEVFLKPLERLAIFGASPAPRLELSTAPAASTRSERWLALHPGSGSEQKNWPESNWTAFIAHVIATSDFNLLLIGGEAEGDRLTRLVATIPRNRLELARSRPLAELGQRLQLCNGFIGHDSGITHLAAAVGVPTLVLWGETNETVWRPRHAGVKVLRNSQGLRRLSVERVVNELQTLTAVWKKCGPNSAHEQS